MKLYLDETVAPGVARALRDLGHDATAAAEHGAEGASDAAQLARAMQGGRALVTFNVYDYIALAHAAASSGRKHAGIVLVDPRLLPPWNTEAAIRALDAFLREQEGGIENQTLLLRVPLCG